MKTFFLLFIFISYTYANIEESALATLQTLEHWNAFRIVLADTKEECFYLPVKLNDTVHVIYQVLKGGNTYIRATFTNPLIQNIHYQPFTQFGWYSQDHAEIPGVYKLCFKNDEYFSKKTLYIAVLAVHQDLLNEANIDASDEKKQNSTTVVDEFSRSVMNSLQSISSNLYFLTAHQTVGRVRHLHDLYTVESNASYVQEWAIIQIIAMIACSAIQVFSIRRLFQQTLSNRNKGNYS